MRRFFTVREATSKDYNREQTNIWATTAQNREAWLKKLEEQYFYLAIEDQGRIVGFASLTREGSFDLLYVHKNYQRMELPLCFPGK